METKLMALHVVVGAGVLGSATALELVQRGHQVRLISRSGSGPAISGIERVATDAANPERLLDAAIGAAALYNCANPPYHRWTSDWPPLAASMLQVAERASAVLVTMSNLYGYGPMDHPMTERDSLAATGRKSRIRAAMWNDALLAHHAGGVNVTEARASDYFGPGVRDQGHIGARTIPPVLAGRPVSDVNR